MAKSLEHFDIAVTIGVFDLLHQGHVDLVRFMRDHADRAYIGIHDDASTFRNKKRVPVQTLNVRSRNVCSFLMPDALLVTKEPTPYDALVQFFHLTRGHRVCYIRGDDWSDFPGREMIADFGWPVIFKPYTKGISSTKIRSQL